jgi:chemotaxis protein MotB
MMALFIVLWMMNASSSVKESVTGYFKDPKAWARRVGAGPANAGEGLRVKKDEMKDLREKIQAALQAMPEFQRLRDNVKMSATGEGLRIDLMESEQGMFFVQGSPNPTPAGESLLKMLAGELSPMSNKIVIEGHTDARPFRNSQPTSGYTNFELSADRANAARRLLIRDGIEATKVVEVRGFADQRLMNDQDPNDPKNRRVSVVVKTSPTDDPPPEEHEAPKAGK